MTNVMIPIRTTALIAALSLVGAVTPAAFAQNTVTATQSNSFTGTISQSATQDSSDSDFSTVDQTSSQGFCLQVNQQNAAAGDDATNSAANLLDSAADVVDSAADVVDSAANLLGHKNTSPPFFCCCCYCYCVIYYYYY
jgi:hypothetical protein